MATVDPFARTESLDAPTLDALVQRFEARGRHPQFAAMLQQYLDAMHIGDAAAVLDVGCGTGLVARAIARRPGFRGRVIGVDRSSYLISAAERLAREEGIGDRAEFRAADASDVDLADGTLDAVVAHTLLSHVDDPLALLREAARVVRHGGAIEVFDGDYASLTFDHADPVKAKKYDDAVMNALVTTPRVMRRMPKLLRAAGLDLVAFFSWVLAEAGQANFWASALEVYRKLIPDAGEMSEDEADGWAAALRADSDAGVFFASCNSYAYVAKRA